MTDESDLTPKSRVAGQLPFVAGALALSLLLLSQIGGQTVWVEDADSFAAQPRFWPGVAIVTMCVAFGLHLLRMQRRRPNRADRDETRRWLRPFEFVVWFMVFVYAVPLIGFLPMSVAFACALTWRLGYRDWRMLLVAAVFAVVTVVVFKGFLGVRIPGAALYELLPAGPRGFFLQYL
jgi:hypothetical protein